MHLKVLFDTASRNEDREFTMGMRLNIKSSFYSKSYFHQLWRKYTPLDSLSCQLIKF